MAVGILEIHVVVKVEAMRSGVREGKA